MFVLIPYLVKHTILHIGVLYFAHNLFTQGNSNKEGESQKLFLKNPISQVSFQISHVQNKPIIFLRTTVIAFQQKRAYPVGLVRLKSFQLSLAYSNVCVDELLLIQLSILVTSFEMHFKTINPTKTHKLAINTVFSWLVKHEPWNGVGTSSPVATST